MIAPRMLSENPGRISRLLLTILLLGILLRILFPMADPPRNLTISGAPVGDPGQHSYGARNRILFGQWSFDEWKPHLGSPLISMAVNWMTFRLFGIGFAAHKAIPIFFSIASLLAFLLLVYRRLPAKTATGAVLFVACSFPLLMYAHVGNRYMPMIFFFLLSIHFFVLGAETGRSRDMVFAALFFILSYASQNHILYMTGVLIFLSGFWLIRRRIKWRSMLAFWGVLAAGMAAWYLAVFLPNQDFFAHFVGHNRLIRYIRNTPQLLANIRDNPFALQFRNDAPVLLLAILGVGTAAALWIRKRKLPALIETAVIWLILSAGFHSIWSYRPTRFYLAIIFPAAVIAAWFLQQWVDRKRAKAALPELAAVAMATGIALIVCGAVIYARFAAHRVQTQPWMACVFAFVFLILAALLWAPRKWRERAAAAFLMLAFAVNLVTYIQWASQREYRIIETADVLTKVLPPSRIAGNWASILSLGGPHQTHLLSGEMGINWHRDFLFTHQVEYLLLTQAGFAKEYREYLRFFPLQMAAARLMARFPIYSAEVQLWELSPPKETARGVEMESLTRRPGHVRADPNARQKMALWLPPHTSCTIQWAPDPDHLRPGNLDLRARGTFRMHITIREAREAIRRNLVLWNSTRYTWRTVTNRGLASGQTMEMHITTGTGGAWLDRMQTATSSP